ncbi:MAG: hypothetical protein Kow0047_02330 [Anaerolineae bacterium]
MCNHSQFSAGNPATTVPSMIRTAAHLGRWERGKKADRLRDSLVNCNSRYESPIFDAVTPASYT